MNSSIILVKRRIRFFQQNEEAIKMITIIEQCEMNNSTPQEHVMSESLKGARNREMNNCP